MKHERSKTAIRTVLTFTAVLVVSLPLAAQAGLTPEQKCEAGQNERAGEYASCLSIAEKRLVRTGDVAAYGEKLDRCETRLTNIFGSLEDAAADKGGSCPSNTNLADLQDFVDSCGSSVASALSGDPLLIDPINCNAALAAVASCDAAALPEGIAYPTCAEAACDLQCDPVDTDTCEHRGGRYDCADPEDPDSCSYTPGEYVCEAPSCSCGTLKKRTACSLPAPDCDPVCEPPTCGMNCDPGQCGDEGCPDCEATCGVPPCTVKCTNWPVSHPCAAVFGCFINDASCTTTCKPPHCAWLNRETSGTPPTCEATIPDEDLIEIPGKSGLDCTAAPGAQDRDWAILCQKPECEIKCSVASFGTGCEAEAACDVDCTDPICEVTCDPVVCSKDAATGALVCSPPTNCAPSCHCRVGTCIRGE